MPIRTEMPPSEYRTDVATLQRVAEGVRALRDDIPGLPTDHDRARLRREFDRVALRAADIEVVRRVG